jgi:hypothetical protein
MMVCLAAPATAQVSIGYGSPQVSIAINLSLYPELVPVPGYPVYYAPRLESNYFFYDGLYWVFQGDNWYASSWYNGPWQLVVADDVPLFVLRIPVRYYVRPPVFFRGWQVNASPRWGEHWGNDWTRRRGGWDRWDRNAVPAAAPLPTYQRQYSGDRYPRADQQQARSGIVPGPIGVEGADDILELLVRDHPAHEHDVRPPIVKPLGRHRVRRQIEMREVRDDRHRKNSGRVTAPAAKTRNT